MSAKKVDSSAVTCKVVLIGDSGVGKSSIINRYTKNTFSSDLLPTLGASFASKVMNFYEYDKLIKFDVKKQFHIFI
jgi:GTPase SAR1 family protein